MVCVIQSLWSAASGMQAQQLKVDTISNNLANLNTAGFKAARVSFQDLAYIRAQGTPMTGTPQGVPTTGSSQVGRMVQVGTGVGPGTILRDFSPGAIDNTGQPFDLAIDGPGFFQVKLSSGDTAYTRDGHFFLSPIGSNQGLLVDAAGNPVLNRNGQTITLRTDFQSVGIDRQGNITLVLSGGTTQSGGQIGLASFANPAGLEAAGQNIYRKTATSGDPTVGAPGSTGLGQIQQGSLEGSNVQVVSEVVSLIVAQRAYELSSKAVQSSDQMLEIANNLRR